MSGQRARSAIVAGLVVVVTISAHTQQRDRRVEVRGTAVLSGAVTSADSVSTPLRRARVTLHGAALVNDRIDVTDDGGRFSFDQLPAGSYTVRAEKPGFVAMNYGASRPGRPGTSVTIGNAQHVDTVTIALPRGAVLTGTILDNDGSPLRGAEVHALRFTMRNGERSLVETGVIRLTDDRGAYRLFGLPPGDYVVGVFRTSDNRGAAAFRMIDDQEVDRTLLALGSSGQVATSAPAPTALLFGFAPVYAPGTAVMARAVSTHLDAGSEATVDVRMDLSSMSTVGGQVAASDGRPVPGLLVQLEPLDTALADRAYAMGNTRLAPRRTGADGRFLFTGVSPGDYRVLAVETTAVREDAATAPMRWAAATVTATGSAIDVPLLLQEPLSFAGRITFDGVSPPAASSVKIALRQTRITPGGEQKTFQARPATAEGAFAVDGLVPERYILLATAPPGWTLRSVISNGRDLLDAPLVLSGTDASTDLVATFTDHPAQLTGRLQAGSGAPANDYFVIAFAEDRAFWFSNSRRITAVHPDTAGRYAIENLPPGRYLIAAVTDVEADEWFDPTFLQQLVAGAQLIVLAEGERKVQDFSIR